MTTKLEEQPVVDSVTVRLPDGKLFRCVCGCNVFHHPEDDQELYECNACGEYYEGGP